MFIKLRFNRAMQQQSSNSDFFLKGISSSNAIPKEKTMKLCGGFNPKTAKTSGAPKIIIIEDSEFIEL